ncbi:MAG TPA: CDP-alcohol phosphatidyltransferase family protein [Kofleriaceae bacterium]|jgi:phosphatidylglycerophosphate synthase|nr:CDP-alcohol phosphatidyltransferase family protein [Kofleriaceae bacterium]
MTTEQPVFVDVGHPGAYAMICGGLSVLERTIRLAGKAGATRAIVPAAPIPLRADLPVAVEWVAEGTAAPEGVQVVRADEVAGVPIRDAASLRKAEKALVAGLGKSHEGPVDQYFNSHFSRPITTALMRTRITPNHITLFATLVGLTGAIWLLGGTWQAFAIGGTLLEIQCILDSCDGEIARLKYQGSKLGQWLDTITDGILDNAFVACISIAVGGIWGTIGLALVIARIYVEIYVYVDVYKRTGTPDQTLFRLWYEDEKATADEIYDRSSFNSHFRSLGRRDVFVAAYWIFCLVNLPEGVILYASVMNGISFVGAAADHLIKTFRRRK